MDGNGKLVTEHTRICKERLLAGIGMQISTADSDAPNAYLNPARRWCIGWWDIAEAHIGDVVQGDFEHASLFSGMVKGFDLFAVVTSRNGDCTTSGR